MPRSADSDDIGGASGRDDFEDIEILKNLLELRASLGREKLGVDVDLE